MKPNKLDLTLFIWFSFILILMIIYLFVWSFDNSGCEKIESILQKEQVVEKLSNCGEKLFSQEGINDLKADLDKSCLDFLEISVSPNFVLDKVSKKKKTFMIALGVGYREQILLIDPRLPAAEVNELKTKYKQVERNVFYVCD